MRSKKAEKCTEINSLFNTYLWEPVGYIFAKRFAKRGWSPNVATIISLILGVIGGLLFSFHNIWINIVGIVLFLLSIIFDCADGQIARLNHSGSIFGRCFDGFCDDVVSIAGYVGLCIHSMNNKIPFTNISWSWWIFPIAIIIGVLFHAEQARVTDYLKNVYMYLVGAHSELSSSKDLIEQFKDKKMNLFNKFLMKSYVNYTKQQEKETPQIQALIKKIKENNNVVPEKVSKEFKNHSLMLKFHNIENASFRTFVLIALLLLDQGFWLFPVIVFFLEPINLIIKWRFSKICKKAREELF